MHLAGKGEGLPNTWTQEGDEAAHLAVGMEWVG